MAVTILYFAWVRELVGTGEETVELPADIATLSDLFEWLADRGGGFAEALGDPAKLRAAIDKQFVDLEAAIGDAKEIAIFPPVTGG